MIRRCIGLMAALHIALNSLILTGTLANLIIIRTKRTVGKFISMHYGMTDLALIRHILFSVRSQLFKTGKFKRVKQPAYIKSKGRGGAVGRGRSGNQNLSLPESHLLSRLLLLTLLSLTL